MNTKTYFKGEFSIRRPITIGIVVALICIALGLMLIWVPPIIHSFSVENIANAFLPGFFSLLSLTGGLFLLVKIMKSESTLLLITSDGLQYGKQHYRWEDITEVGITSKHTRRKELNCHTRLFPFGIELPISRGLDSNEIKTLFATLRREVLVHHPHIHLSSESQQHSSEGSVEEEGGRSQK